MAKAERLSQQEPHQSRELLLLSRNFYYGAAATSVIILLSLSAVKIEDTALRLAACADAIALPFFVLLGMIHETYYRLDKKGYPHRHLWYVRISIAVIILIPCLAFFTAIGTLFWYLLPDAFWLFFYGTLISGLLGHLYLYSLDHWWVGGAPGPESDIES